MQASGWFGGHRRASVAKSWMWAMTSNASATLLQFLGAIFLTRILHPADFGLFSLAFVFYVMPSQLVGPALSAAMIQSKSLDGKQTTNLFWIVVSTNAVLATGLFLARSYIAAWFQEPLLALLVPCFAGILVVEGIAVPYHALVSRAMRFDINARITLVTGLSGLAVAITLSLLGWGVWSLVAQSMVMAVGRTAVLIWTVPWRPGAYNADTKVASFLHFGAGSGIALVVHMVASQAQTLLLGAFASATQIGYYSRGLALLQRPLDQIMGPLRDLLLPALSAKQHDHDLLGRALSRANSIVHVMLLPPVIWMFVCGREIALCVLGDEWGPAGYTLQWFAGAAFPNLLMGNTYKAMAAIGKPTAALSVRVMFLPFVLAAMAFAATKGAAACAAVFAVLEWLSMPFIVWVIVGINPAIMRYVVPPLVTCVVQIIVTSVAMFLAVNVLNIRDYGPAAVSVFGLALANLLFYVLLASTARGRAAFSDVLDLFKPLVQAFFPLKARL
jgi:O-antigen/teichoic acid export membrane protein